MTAHVQVAGQRRLHAGGGSGDATHGGIEQPEPPSSAAHSPAASTSPAPIGLRTTGTRGAGIHHAPDAVGHGRPRRGRGHDRRPRARGDQRHRAAATA